MQILYEALEHTCASKEKYCVQIYKTFYVVWFFVAFACFLSGEFSRIARTSA